MTTVVEGQDVAVRDLSGYAYSFVLVKALPLHQAERREFRTKHVRASLWPGFHETVEFDLERKELERQTLYLYLYEMNRWTQQEGVGQISLQLAGLGLDIGKEHTLKAKLKPYNPLVRETI